MDADASEFVSRHEFQAFFAGGNGEIEEEEEKPARDRVTLLGPHGRARNTRTAFPGFALPDDRKCLLCVWRPPASTVPAAEAEPRPPRSLRDMGAALPALARLPRLPPLPLPTPGDHPKPAEAAAAEIPEGCTLSPTS